MVRLLYLRSRARPGKTPRSAPDWDRSWPHSLCRHFRRRVHCQPALVPTGGVSVGLQAAGNGPFPARFGHPSASPTPRCQGPSPRPESTARPRPQARVLALRPLRCSLLRESQHSRHDAGKGSRQVDRRRWLAGLPRSAPLQSGRSWRLGDRGQPAPYERPLLRVRSRLSRRLSPITCTSARPAVSVSIATSMPLAMFLRSVGAC